MAKFSFKISSKDIEKQLEAILDSPAIRQNFVKQIKPIVAESINSAIESTKTHFQPHKTGGEDLVGKLGVGKDGIPDYDKLNNAYKSLLVGTKDSGPSKITISAGKSTFALATLNIDKEEFYNAFNSNYISFSKSAPEDKRIPWMRYYLNGMPTNDDFVYIDDSDPEFTPKNSRTGIGKMASRIFIPKESFTLPGYGENFAFSQIFKQLNNNLNSGTVKGKINKALARAFKNA